MSLERCAECLPYGKILVPYDGSAGSTNALLRAMRLVKECGGDLTVFSVDENVPRFAPGVGEVDEDNSVRALYFSELHQQARAIAAQQKVPITVATASGHAARSIVQHAREHNFELIVIGHSGHSGIWGTLLGSTTARVVDQAICDVLVVR